MVRLCIVLMHKIRVGDVLGAKSCLEHLFPSPLGWEMFSPK